MPRYFLAITLPESVQKSLTQLMPVATSGVNRVSADHLHLTLHFLGEVTPPDLETLTLDLSAIEEPSFELHIQGLGAFPNDAAPRILWAGVEFSENLERLHSHLATILINSIGYEPEQRPFTPHITLARMKTNAQQEEIQNLIQQSKNLSLSTVPVRSFVLFESTLTPEGPIYREVQSFPLRTT